MSQPLPRASRVRAAGTWREAALDSVVLGFDERHRRRLAMRGVRGTAFLLDLEDAVALRGGDALVLEEGEGLIEVVAAPEPLVEITGTSDAIMVRIAWHLGNRHLPVQLVGKRLRLRRDHVIETMVEGLGGLLRAIEAPFDPEGGAYADPFHAHPNHGHGHMHQGRLHKSHSHQGHAAHGHPQEPSDGGS